MSNILQFLIDIRSRENGVIGQVTRLQNRLDEADKSANRLANTVGVKLKKAFMSLPGAEFLTNPIVALTAGVGIVSKMGMEAEKTAVSFNVLTGSVETGTKLLEQLNKYADTTIYDRLGTQKAAQTMLGFGVSIDSVMSDLRMLGDVAMGDNEKMQRMSLVFGQVAAAGKLQAEDLNQLIDAGYNPLLDISALTGKSISQLKDDMSKGLVPFEMLRAAFQRATSDGGKFANMTEEIAKTPYGAFQQTLGDVTSKLLELYNVIQPLLIPAFQSFSALLSVLLPPIRLLAKFVNWLVSLYKEWNPLIIAVTAAVAAYSAAAFFNTFVLKGWTIAQWAHVTALIAAEKAQHLLNIAMTANPIGLIIAAIAAVIAILVVCWNKFAGFRAFILTAWDTIKGFGQAIYQFLVRRFMELVESIGHVGKALVSLVKGDFEAAWEEAKKGAKKIVGVESGKKLVNDVVGVGGNIGNYWDHRYAQERAKDAAKENAISDPQAAAGTMPQLGTGGGTGEGGGNADMESKANSISTGGTRNTQITINISKFFDYLNVTMMDKADTTQIQRIVLESMNRALETATSAAR